MQEESTATARTNKWQRAPSQVLAWDSRISFTTLQSSPDVPLFETYSGILLARGMYRYLMACGNKIFHKMSGIFDKFPGSNTRYVRAKSPAGPVGKLEVPRTRFGGVSSAAGFMHFKDAPTSSEKQNRNTMKNIIHAYFTSTHVSVRSNDRCNYSSTSELAHRHLGC